MNIFFQLMGILVIVFGVINLLRMTLLLIGSDFYNLVNLHKFKNLYLNYYPKISVVIPAFNESLSILKCVSSVLNSNYPKDRLEVIVCDDGSTDNTYQLVKDFKLKNQIDNLVLITQQNSGKAHSLNNGMKNYSTGELVMCLDADSYIDQNSVMNMVKYFQDQKVMALASNVKVERTKGILNLVQQFEYIVSYQMKRAQSLYNIEYIIGGIGSTFRKSYLSQIGFYDANTITEDIDLTMKILRSGNKNIRVIYAPDVICWTQGVLSIKDLIKQRYRWKWGRYQTFLKNKSMFFSTQKQFTSGLTWIYLPFAIWSDLTFLFEPIVLGFILFISIVYHDPLTILSSFTVLTFYILMNILAEETISLKSKLQLILITPLIYFLFYILSFVEYMALVKSIFKLPNLSASLNNNLNTWKPVQRSGF